MAKGLKMHYAKDKRLGRLYKIEDVNPDKHGDFVCEDCGVDIKYTRSHTRLSSDEEVDAYFSLKPNVNHKDSCKYNVAEAIKKIVNFSQSVEEGKPVISTEEDGTHIYRLNFLEKAINQVTLFVNQKEPDNNKEADKSASKIGTRYILTDKQIASYFRSATGVAKIKSMIEHKDDDSILKNKVRIKYRDQDIQWNDFYYERKDYQKLYEVQHKYPVALKVIISDNKVHDNKNQYSVRCVALRIEEKRTILYSIFLHFNDKNLANQMKTNTTYIVLGKIWCSTIKNDEAKKLIYKTINISIFNANQIEEI